MKTTIFNKKAPAFFGAAAVLLAAVSTTGCKTDAAAAESGAGDTNRCYEYGRVLLWL